MEKKIKSKILNTHFWNNVLWEKNMFPATTKQNLSDLKMPTHNAMYRRFIIELYT